MKSATALATFLHNTLLGIIEAYTVRCATPQELAEREKNPNPVHVARHKYIIARIARKKVSGKYPVFKEVKRVEPPLPVTMTPAACVAIGAFAACILALYFFVLNVAITAYNHQIK